MPFRISKASRMPSVEWKLFLSACGLLLAVAFLGACGKRRAPQPPTERVRQQIELRAAQLGSAIVLSWKMPPAEKSSSDLNSVKRVDVYRLAQPMSGVDASMSEDEFLSESTLISSLPVELKDLGRDYSISDPLQLAGQPVHLRYGVRLVNASGQRAALSNIVRISPVGTVALPPTGLEATASQEAILLKWMRPALNIDGSQSLSILGFNLYRKEKSETDFRLLNAAPIQDEQYSDLKFDFGKSYSYRVRAVSLGSDGAPIESGESAIYQIQPKDVFAPRTPEYLTIAASERSISIFFASNPETDLSGYKVYRSTEPDAPLDRWMLLTEKPLATNTFQDTSVESGKTYFYYVTAVDLNGNESGRSIVVSEVVP